MKIKVKILNIIQKTLKHPCSYCGIRESVWWYGPGTETACEECVPRGCSCNKELKPEYEYLGEYFYGLKEIPKDVDLSDENLYTEPVDKKDRKYPCCEWFMFSK